VDEVIVVQGLRLDYGWVRAVDDVSFSVRQGEVYALLGPNGAGKSTTVEILEGHRERTAGTVSVLGTDPATGGRAYRERIGVVLRRPASTSSSASSSSSRCTSGSTRGTATSTRSSRSSV
jgi:ABC-type multidrug transport system ATPase subunit